MAQFKQQDNSSETISEAIAEAMQDLKAKEIVSMDLRQLPNATTDFFVVCEANSDRQVQAIARNVEDHLKEHLAERPWHKEGYENKEWILLDYINVVAHVFSADKRRFYDIDGLWADARIRSYESID